jgi:hypothetical protein
MPDCNCPEGTADRLRAAIEGKTCPEHSATPDRQAGDPPALNSDRLLAGLLAATGATIKGEDL